MRSRRGGRASHPGPCRCRPCLPYPPFAAFHLAGPRRPGTDRGAREAAASGSLRTKPREMGLDRPRERVGHPPISVHVGVQTVRGAAETVRSIRIRHGGVRVGERDVQDLGERFDPHVQGEDRCGRLRCRLVVGQHAGRDRNNRGVECVGVHHCEVPLHLFRAASAKDVVDTREDDHVGRLRAEDISFESPTDFRRGLSVNPSIQDSPLCVRTRHPMRVLTLRIPPPLRRGLERRQERGGSRGRGIPESDNREPSRGHRTRDGILGYHLTRWAATEGRARTLYGRVGGPHRMPRAVKPSRKRDGRLGPPEGYPKDPEKYADPANWKYPVHTPFHARADPRYFKEPRNRVKYTPEEQAYIDKKINEALERFGVAVKIRDGKIEDEAGVIQADVPLDKDIDHMHFDELLPLFLGTNRLASAKGIDPSLVSVDKETDTLLSGRVKDYTVRIDRHEKRLEHDCVDFRTNRAVGRLMCKHLGAFLMRLDRPKATRLLRELLRERDHWTFE